MKRNQWGRLFRYIKEERTMKKNDYFVIADQYIDSMGNLYGRD
jgi:hypothetical protein